MQESQSREQESQRRELYVIKAPGSLAKAGPPPIIAVAGRAATFAWDEFFAGQISNQHTRTAYLRAVRRFLAWCEEHELPLEKIEPGHVGRYFGEFRSSIPTKKLAMSAIRGLFDVLVLRHVVILNPALSVRTERYSAVEGRTPLITVEQASRLLASTRMLARMKQQRRRVKSRKRLALKSAWLSAADAVVNPVNVRLALELERMAREARRCALDHIMEIVGRITEDQDVLSSNAILFLVTEGKTLRRVQVHNAARATSWESPVVGRGIVRWVAREGRPRLIEDTNEGVEDYVPENPRTRCELAIPVVHDQQVIGVLNLESPRPKSLGWETLLRIEARLAELVPHLLVLRALETTAPNRCPWHPLVHGWDLQRVMQRLCHAVADELGSDATKCTIWYVDQAKAEVFAYGTYGYDWEFRDHKTLSLGDSPLGEHLQTDRRPVVRYSPSDNAWFLKPDQAEQLDIETGILGKVYRDNDAGGMPMSLINVYLNRVDNPEFYGDRERLVETMLPEFAHVLRRLVEAFEVQRERLALSLVDLELQYRQRHTVRAQLEGWMAKICQMFMVPAGSLFGYCQRRQALICLTSTGFRRATATEPLGIDERDDHVEDKTINPDRQRGHTVVAFERAGFALRRNRLHDKNEQGLPAGCPQRGGRTAAEFIPGEQFAAGESAKRRFLACAVMQNQSAVGVLRLVRPEGSFPFTRCDERLIEAVCRRMGKNKSEDSAAELVQHSLGQLVAERLVERNVPQPPPAEEQPLPYTGMSI